MSIIILTPPPKKPGTTSQATEANVTPGTLSTDITGIGQRLESAFLHLIGLEGHRFDTFEQLRDFAQAQIDATAPVAAAPAAPQA